MKFTKAQLKQLISEALQAEGGENVTCAEAVASSMHQALSDLLQDNMDLLGSNTLEIFMGNTLNDATFEGYPVRIEDCEDIAKKATEVVLKSGWLDGQIHTVLKRVLINSMVDDK